MRPSGDVPIDQAGPPATYADAAARVSAPGYVAGPPGYYAPAPYYYQPTPYYYGPTIGIGFYGGYGWRHGYRHW